MVHDPADHEGMARHLVAKAMMIRQRNAATSQAFKTAETDSAREDIAIGVQLAVLDGIADMYNAIAAMLIDRKVVGVNADGMAVNRILKG